MNLRGTLFVMKKILIIAGTAILLAVVGRIYWANYQMKFAENTQNTNVSKNTPVQTTQATSTGAQNVVGSGEMKIYVNDGDVFDSVFVNPVHIDLFSNDILISSIDSQSGTMVSFGKVPYGEYVVRVKAEGFKESVQTFNFDNKNNYNYGTTVVMFRQKE